MYYDNLNRKQDDDLKFIPLNISEPFTDKESSWFPIIDMALPTFSELPNSFALGFAIPGDNFNIQENFLNTLDYIQSDSVNVQSNNINQGQKEFEKNFNLEYPSETFGEALPSYNKEEKCKKNTNTNKGSMINSNNTNMNPGSMSNPNNTNTNMNPGSMTNPNNANMNKGQMTNFNSNMNEMNNENTKSMQNRQDYIEEPIHMELLRNLNFQNYLGNSYRGETENQLDEDMIFNMVKSDNSIVDTCKAYNIPKPISDLIIKKIIRISLENSKNKWGE